MIDCELIIEQEGLRYSLDLFDNEPIPLVRSISDIQNISERTSDYTKTLTLPGSNNNNDIFSNIFNVARGVVNETEINFTPDFNPALKANCTLYKRGIPQIVGYLQLTDIKIVDGYDVTYECVIIGRFANLFTEMGDKKLSELDLSEFNHTWNKANIAASWVSDTGVGYYYGLIDYGLGNGVDYYVDYMFPQVYVKTIIDKIFEEAGFRYESDFFTSDLFKRFVVPYSGKQLRLSSEGVEDRLFYANRITDGPLNFFGSGTQNVLPFNNTVKDTDPAGYDDTTFAFTVQETGKQQFIMRGQMFFESTASQLYDAAVIFTRNGLPFIGITILHEPIATSGTVTRTFELESGFVSVTAGDVIECKIQSLIGSRLNLKYALLSGSIFFNQHSGEIAEGGTMDLSLILPDDVKQTDFFASIIKTFNLYIDVDKLDNKKLIIEPRDDFYSTSIVDLSSQVDVSRGVKIMPLGALEYKSYNYTFSEDGDSLNKQYQDKYTEPYGTAKVKVENDFVKDDYTQQVIFAPRPLSKISDMVITRIIFKTATGQRVESPAKISLLMVSPSVAVPTSRWTLKERSGANTDYALVPYVGHLDDVNDPQFDLNFSMPREVSYTASIYTNNNLFNVYHRKGIFEISNPNSKIVEYYIKMSELGLQRLSFRDIYLIDQQYYRLYSVDADLNSDSPTRMQFLKLAGVPEFFSEQGNVNGGIEDIGGTDIPIYTKQFQQKESVYENFTEVSIQGSDNNVQTENVLVNSNGNGINGTEATVLGGSGNQVLHNGATIIGSTDAVTDRDDQTIINNIDKEIGITTILIDTDLEPLDAAPVEIVPLEEGYWIELVAMYATLYFNGASPVAYNNSTLTACYFDGGGYGSAINTIDAGFINQTTAIKKMGVRTTNYLFESNPIYLLSSEDLGSSGNGILKIEAHYRLHPIMQ